MYTEPESSPRTEAEAVAALIEADLLGETLAEIGVALVPKTHRMEDLSGFLDAPRRHKARVTVSTVEAFRRYLLRFGLLASDPEALDASPLAVFADPMPGRYEGVLDYHQASGPAHGDHRCTLQLRLSEPWKTWTGKATKRFSQRDFALFVEERLADIHAPAAADVLTAVKSIEAARNVTFKSNVDLDRGDVLFHFDSQTKGVGSVAFPERITLGLPVFEGGEPYKVEARLRYTLDDEGGLALWFDLVNADTVHRTAADEVLAEVETLAGPGNVFVGSLA